MTTSSTEANFYGGDLNLYIYQLNDIQVSGAFVVDSIDTRKRETRSIHSVVKLESNVKVEYTDGNIVLSK